MSIKPSIAEELGEKQGEKQLDEGKKPLNYDDIDEDAIPIILPKVIKMYDKAKDGEVSNWNIFQVHY